LAVPGSIGLAALGSIDLPKSDPHLTTLRGQDSDSVAIRKANHPPQYLGSPFGGRSQKKGED
jgi:hypothetical protein